MGKAVLVSSSSGHRVREGGSTLGLTNETYVGLSQLRIWYQRNGNRCYVPEWLLKEWGIVPGVGWY